MTRFALRGANLGGWLVLERWMTPSLFIGTDAQDEYSFMQTADAIVKINTHRKTFITESDFSWIKQAGLDAVRIPVGYWVLESDGVYAEAKEYLDWAFEMSEKYRLKVLLDLHGAPGSQNGHDHSGHSGEANWFDDVTYRDKSIEILTALHERYRRSAAYWGVQLLNEPSPHKDLATVREFYRHAAREIDGDQYLVFSDAFRPRLMSNTLKNDHRSVMDVHLYHMSAGLRRVLPVKLFVGISGWWYGALIKRLSRHQPIIIGEWSTVLRGESLVGFSESKANNLMQRFGESQITAYDTHALAWFYWSYKTESPNKWNFRYLVDSGFIEL